MHTLDTYCQMVVNLGKEYMLYPVLNTSDGVSKESQLAGVFQALSLGHTAILALTHYDGEFIAKVTVNEDVFNVVDIRNGYNMEVVLDYLCDFAQDGLLLRGYKLAEARYYELQEAFNLCLLCNRGKKLPYVFYRDYMLERSPTHAIVFYYDTIAGEYNYWDGKFIPADSVTFEEESEICEILSALADVLID